MACEIIPPMTYSPAAEYLDPATNYKTPMIMKNDRTTSCVYYSPTSICDSPVQDIGDGKLQSILSYLVRR